MRRMLEKLSLVLTAIASVAVLIMMLAMTFDALWRKAVGALPGAYEVTIACSVAVMFLPQGYAQMRRANVSVDILTSRFSPRTRAVLGVIAAFFGVVVSGVLTWAGAIKAWDSTLIGEIMSGQIYYPIWPLRWVVPFAGGVLTLEFIATLFDEFGKILRRN